MRNAVFMSIKEIHINRILTKIKNHEFRTKKPKKDFDYIIVYVPTPIKELKYILKVKQPVASPNKIIIDGYGNKEFNFTAPQSFAYEEKYKELLEYIDKVETTKLY